MTRYRLARAHVMVNCGVAFVVAAVAVAVAFFVRDLGDAGAVVAFLAALVAVLALVGAAVVYLRPPTALRLDETGLRTRRDDLRWNDVDDVSVGGGQLRFDSNDGTTSAIALALLSTPDQARLVNDVYSRLNTAHGYRRFTFPT